MSEFTPKPSGVDSDPDNLRWATTAAQGVDYIEPVGAKLNSGWVFQDVPPYHTLNWFYRLAALMIAWLTAWRIRAFDSLESGISEVDDGHMFIVGRPGGYTAPLSQVWGVSGGGSPTVPEGISCDGEGVFYFQGSTVYRASRTTGADVVSRDLGVQVNCVVSDGAFLLCVTNANAGSEVRLLDRATLADVAPFPLGSGNNTDHCATNGQLYITAVGSSADLYNSGGSAGSVAHGSNISALGIDWSGFYTASGVNIKGWDLGFSLLWTASYPGLSAGRSFATDGTQVFLACDVGTSSGGETFNVISLDRETGRINWIAGAPDPGSAIDAVAACADDRWLYVAAGQYVHKLDKTTGQTVATYDHGNTITGLSCDGDGLFISGADGGGLTHLRRLNTGNGSRMFIKTTGTDGFRPFAKLAIPAN
jgi:hypothetical protein